MCSCVYCTADVLGLKIVHLFLLLSVTTVGTDNVWFSCFVEDNKNAGKN